MRLENFVPHIVTGENNNSFVGMKIVGNFDSEDYEKDDILDLLKTLSIAKSSSKSEVKSFDSHNEGNDLAITSYIWIIEDYLRNGFFINSSNNGLFCI